MSYVEFGESRGLLDDIEVMGGNWGDDDDVCVGWRMMGYGDCYNLSYVGCGGNRGLLVDVGVIGDRTMMFVLTGECLVMAAVTIRVREGSW